MAEKTIMERTASFINACDASADRVHAFAMLRGHATHLARELQEVSASLEVSAAREAAYASHHCESEGCAHEGAYTAKAAEWADKFHAMKAEIAALKVSLSDVNAKLAEVEKWATSARRTNSRDIQDWKDDMLNIENIVQRGSK